MAVLQDGPYAGKIAAIVDVIDQNRVLIDGPCTGIPRQEYRIKNLHLTPLATKFPFSSRTKVVRKAWEEVRGGIMRGKQANIREQGGTPNCSQWA